MQVEEGEMKVGLAGAAIAVGLHWDSWKSLETRRPWGMQAVLRKARTEELRALQSLIRFLTPL